MTGGTSGTRLAGRYRLERVLGRGGMATVHEAVDEVLDRRVAVKVMLPQYGDDPRFLERFRREARAAARLNHPNIVAVHDTGDDDGTLFIVMELVDGASLDEADTVDRDRALEVVAAVCGALEYAHDRGVVHRDVKPGNILVAEDGTVKVTDFGIARAVGTDTITATSVLGTAAYLSPEQARGDEVDRRTDLYALGVVLYELVTGRPPFTGASPIQVALRHVADSPVSPSEVADGVGPQLDAIVLTALAKDVTDRYADAAAMRSDVVALRQGRPVSVDRDRALAAAAGLAAEGDDTVRLADGGEHRATAVLPPAPPVAPPDAPRTPADTAARDRSRRWLVPWVALAAVVVLALLALTAVRGDGTTRVPQLKGLDRDAAVAAIEEAGLEVARVDEQPHDSIPAGTVLASRPQSGREVEEGSGVVIAVSTGPAQPPTPPPPPADEEEDEEEEEEEKEEKGDGGDGRGNGRGRGGGPGND